MAIVGCEVSLSDTQVNDDTFRSGMNLLFDTSKRALELTLKCMVDIFALSTIVVSVTPMKGVVLFDGY